MMGVWRGGGERRGRAGGDEEENVEAEVFIRGDGSEEEELMSRRNMGYGRRDV